MIRFLGAKPVPIPLVEDARIFVLISNLLRSSITPRTKMLVLNLAAESHGRRDSCR